MWIRKIFRVGQANGIILPPAMLRSLGWRRGDHVSVSVIGEGTVVLQIVPENKLTDQIIAAAKPEAIITHE
jgi:antitoxin component of MazEF toxin-antitoxin module